MKAGPVLLVDHDTSWCAQVCRFLEPHGISVVTAETLDTAALLARLEKPRAVLMSATARQENGNAIAVLRHELLRDVPVGFVKKSAALDALLLMLGSGAAGRSKHAA